MCLENDAMAPQDRNQWMVSGVSKVESLSYRVDKPRFALFFPPKWSNEPTQRVQWYGSKSSQSSYDSKGLSESIRFQV